MGQTVNNQNSLTFNVTAYMFTLILKGSSATDKSGEKITYSD